MKAIVLILLPLIVFNADLSVYSIKGFLDYLQQTGYYEVIIEIKFALGNDIAIDFCKEFVQSQDCEQVVKIYMTRIYVRGDIKKPNLEPIYLMKILHQDEIQKILSKFYSIKEIEDKTKRILIKRGILPKKIEEFKDKYA